MSRNNLFRAAAAAVLALASTGCVDYLNHYDTVTLAAGDAVNHNLILHHDDPFNPDSLLVDIDTDGERASDAVRRYRDSQKAVAQPSNNVTVNINN